MMQNDNYMILFALFIQVSKLKNQSQKSVFKMILFSLNLNC